MRKLALPTTLHLFLAVAFALAPMVVIADELPDDEHASASHTEKPELHRNHFGSFLGASAHLDTDETGFTLGLEYARVFTQRWALAGYVEMVGGALERDVIVAAGVIYYPIRGLGLVLAPGIELVDKNVEHNGQVEEEEENEFLIRFGAGYGFPIAPSAGIGPAVFADYAGDRWTIVYGVAWVAGF